MGSKTTIESILLFVSTERFNLITEQLIFNASFEYEAVWKNVKPLGPHARVDETKVTQFLIAVGNSLISNNWKVAKRLCTEAEKNYKILRKVVAFDVVKPYIIKIDDDLPPKPDKRVPKLNFKQPHELGVKLIEPVGGTGTVKKEKAAERKDHHNANPLRSSSKPVHLEELMENQLTNLQPFCKTKEIIDELARLYKMEWRAAFEHCRIANSNGDTIKFLREILRETYNKVCLPIAETQIILMQREALKIVKGPNQMSYAELPDKVILEDYRRHYATLSLKYVKKAFFEKHMNNLLHRFNIVYKNLPIDEESVDIYAARCVEVTWFMCVHDPRLILDFDNKGQLDDKELFKPYREEGDTLSNVVWPAIRQLEGGRILNEGVAIFY